MFKKKSVNFNIYVNLMNKIIDMIQALSFLLVSKDN